MAIYKILVKRIMDVVISFFALIILSPIFFIISLLIKYKLGSPVIFKQIRPGKNGKLFKMYKFRTMTEEKDFLGNSLTDEERLTNFGKLLRSTSLDELPELWNILIGDMSIIGPRPLLVEYLPLYNENQMKRHNVRPGLTGWAQVNGRNAISWEDKFILDLEYVKNISFWLDVRIFFLTIVKVFIRDGISSKDSVTTEKFNGEN